MDTTQETARTWQNSDYEFHGEMLCNTDLGNIAFHVSRFESNARVALHKHTDAYICFLVSGSLHERVGNRHWKHHPLTLIVHPAGEEHEDAFEGDGFCVNLQITPAWANEWLSCATTFSDRIAFDRGPMLYLGFRLLRNYNAWRLESAVIDLEEIAMEALSAHRSFPTLQTMPRLSAVIDRLESDPSASFRLSEYAKLAELHPVYLARAFRKQYGMSLGEYQRHVRLRHALNLLANSDLPISYLAADCGFSDQSHLTHFLRRSTGFTPKALRRLCRDSLTQVQRVQDHKLRRA